MMHDQEYCHDIGEGYGTSSLSKIAGLLTYRYMKLFCCKYGEIAKMNAISKIETLMEYEKENCFIDYFIRNKNLESTLLKLLSFRESSFQITNTPKSCRCLGKIPLPEMGTNLLL